MKAARANLHVIHLAYAPSAWRSPRARAFAREIVGLAYFSKLMFKTKTSGLSIYFWWMLLPSLFGVGMTSQIKVHFPETFLIFCSFEAPQMHFLIAKSKIHTILFKAVSLYDCFCAFLNLYSRQNQNFSSMFDVYFCQVFLELRWPFKQQCNFLSCF